MASKYYNNLYDIEDTHRRNKYYQLLLASLKNDLKKWKLSINQNGKCAYNSPSYNGSVFIIDVLYVDIAYIKHSKPLIIGHDYELITDSFGKELLAEVIQLKNTIYTQDIYDIEKEIGNKNDRKEKLESIEIEQLKILIEDTYQDWLKDNSEISAKMISKIIYAYRKKELFYNIWMEKFGDFELIVNELNKIK